MEMNATAFRKSLFQTLDRALEGEPVSVTYKGARLRVVPAKKRVSKLSRAVEHDTMLVPWESIIGPDPEIMRLWEEKWDKKGTLD
jgi:antitoxin (DNA-binding transcriptional repressor) of toxin-antitoxin stability system